MDDRLASQTLSEVGSLSSTRCPLRDFVEGPTEGVAELLRLALTDSCGELDPAFSPPRVDSYAHPNGFAKIQICQNSMNGSRLTLHVWSSQYVDGDIHNHRWDFSSRVLSGTVVNTLYCGLASPTGDLMVVTYRPFNGGLSYELRATGARLDAWECDILVVGPGEFYSMRRSEFHRAASRDVSRTLMWRAMARSESAEMWLPDESRPSGTLANECLTAMERSNLIRDALNAL